MIHTNDYKRRREDKFTSFSKLVHVSKMTGCWDWMGYKDKLGYGHFRFGSRKLSTSTQWLAHRFSYMMFGHTLIQGLSLDHLCRNTGCVNPRHLEQVTHRVNVLRGFGWAGRNSRKTSCPNRHLYDGENTAIVNGGRSCKKCAADRNRRRCYRRNCPDGPRGHKL